jgi:signal transduction histidine kinase
VTIRLSGNAEVATFEMQDRGIGIDETQRVRLFTRFERGLPGRFAGGFGLGLWITHQIVDAMGGTIAVSSEPGKGSVFSVVIPRHPQSYPRVESVEEPAGREVVQSVCQTA